ncbi:LOW QUALITY PROTEIN: hypothetical protein MAR_010491 [Mya arenaria]|uniref:Uncharacterized protein n=1 Tax=Mya arenaria TaxID=6604 RepID=A0ABY7E1Q5_MYAAR|nr:LOW QUALITY PROTEIN: hypothetical protein MAR_010491 [Mya arenaria]
MDMFKRIGDVISEPASFHSNIEVNLEGTDVSDLYTTMTDRIMEAISNFQRDVIGCSKISSAWRFIQSSMNHCEVTLIFDSPKSLHRKRLPRTWYPIAKHAERIDKSLKDHKDLLDMNGIEYPVTLKAIDRFERQNATISVNVYGYENGDVYPLRVSKHEHNTCVNLLLIDDGEKQHYCLIKSMSRLMSAQSSKNEHTRHYCLRCLNSFISEDFLSKHKEYRDSNEAVKIEMPKKGSTLNFKHFFKSMRVPFIVYADFKSFTQKLDTAQPHPYDSYTKQYQKHTPSGLCYYIKCFDDEVYKRINIMQNPVIYTKQTEDEDLRFIDSFKFMASSLDKLVGYLQKDQFVNLESKYKGKQLSLLKRKGVYPYDYVDGLEKLAETQLPPKEEF